MPSATYITASEEETIALGRQLARKLPEQACVLLTGNLGAGKTTLAKGLVEGRGAALSDEVSSPTFALIHEYGDDDGDPARVYHIDLYRLDTEAEVEGLGLDEIFARPALVIVEWGERFPRVMPVPRVEVRLRNLGEERREIAVVKVERSG